MVPYKLINIGDVYKHSWGQLEWVVLEKNDEEKMIKVISITNLPGMPLHNPIWKKNTDRLFTIKIKKGKMRTKYNFVSNSSSTSFILGWNDKDFVKCEKCGFKPRTPSYIIDSYVNNFNSEDDTELLWNNIEEEKEKREEQIQQNDHWIKEDGENCLQQLLEFSSFDHCIGVSCSYHDHSEQELRELQNQGLIKMEEY